MFDGAADDFLELLFAASDLDLLFGSGAVIEIAMRDRVRAKRNQRLSGERFQRVANSESGAPLLLSRTI